jgi:hypothetical protein
MGIRERQVEALDRLDRCPRQSLLRGGSSFRRDFCAMETLFRDAEVAPMNEVPTRAATNIKDAGLP